MKEIRTIHPDIDEDFLVPLIVDECERRYLLVGIFAILGILLGGIVVITYLLMNG